MKMMLHLVSFVFSKVYLASFSKRGKVHQFPLFHLYVPGNFPWREVYQDSIWKRDWSQSQMVKNLDVPRYISGNNEILARENKTTVDSR